jgi:hypothetical protein
LGFVGDTLNNTSAFFFRFPQNHLGKLMGLAALIGAVFSLIQYPLFIVMEVWFGGRTIEVGICVLT